MRQNLTALIVDDHAPLNIVLAQIFANVGFAVRTATDGFAALAQMRLCRPNLLLSDLNMAGMSGFELLSIVRRRFPEIAVVAMSGSFSGLIVPPHIAADAFYPKGTSTCKDLLRVVEDVLNRPDLSSGRTDVPLWIDRRSLHRSQEMVHVGCPECLRTFGLGIRNVAETCRAQCPHCCFLFAIAIATRAVSEDITMIRAAAS